jgi:hypothetical protein
MAVEFHLDADGVAESLTFMERGSSRECERVGDAPGAPPPLAEVLACTMDRSSRAPWPSSARAACAATCASSTAASGHEHDPVRRARALPAETDLALRQDEQAVTASAS